MEGLHSYQAKTIHLKYPELRKEEEQPLYSLAASFEAKRLELKELLEKEIPGWEIEMSLDELIADLSLDDPRFSTQAVFMPSCAARMAAT